MAETAEEAYKRHLKTVQTMNVKSNPQSTPTSQPKIYQTTPTSPSPGNGYIWNPTYSVWDPPGRTSKNVNIGNQPISTNQPTSNQSSGVTILKPYVPPPTGTFVGRKPHYLHQLNNSTPAIPILGRVLSKHQQIIIRPPTVDLNNSWIYTHADNHISHVDNKPVSNTPQTPGWYYTLNTINNVATPYHVTETFNPMAPLSETNIPPPVPIIPDGGKAPHPALDPANWNSPNYDAMYQDLRNNYVEYKQQNPNISVPEIEAEMYGNIKRKQRQNKQKKYVTRKSKPNMNPQSSYNIENLIGMEMRDEYKVKRIPTKRKQKTKSGKRYNTQEKQNDFMRLVF